MKWSLPEIAGTDKKYLSSEKKIKIDDVKLFEERIKKQIQDIKDEEKRPTHLTVKQIEDIQKLAYDEAYQQAYEEAYNKGVKDSADYIESQLIEERRILNKNALQLQQCFDMLSNPVKEMDIEVEQQLTDMVFSFCKHILSHKINNDSAHILRLIKESIARLPMAKRRISINLNPTDIKLLNDSEVDFTDDDWKIVSDESISAGGCLIQTDASSVDVNIDDRLRTITRQLYGDLKMPAEESINLNQNYDSSDDENINPEPGLEADDEQE